jgi:hypothetical protein
VIGVVGSAELAECLMVLHRPLDAAGAESLGLDVCPGGISPAACSGTAFLKVSAGKRVAACPYCRGNTLMQPPGRRAYGP